MDGDLGYWPELYSNLYSPMGNDSHYMEPDDVGYDTVHYTHLPPELADMNGFFRSTMSTDYLATSSIDTSYAQDAPYLPGNMTTNQRHHHHQQLHIDTRLTHYQTNDSESSTASSSSLPRLLATPSHQSYPNQQLSVHIFSPRSAPAEGRSLISDFEMISPPSASPMSHYSSKFGGDNAFDPPTPPRHIEPDEVTQVPMPHILEWKRVIEQSGMNDFVPQAVYQPYTEADRKRYIRDVELHETIFFLTDDPPEWGISLDDALKQRLRNLNGKDDRMFVGCGPSVSIRIQWPGYPPWSKQIPTMDFKNPKGHITRAKLAKNIATCIRRFAEFAQDKPMEAESDRRWKIGKRHIRVEDLILVSLHHVSKGSWQPQLRLRSPFSTFSHQWDEPVPLVPTS